MSPATAPRPAKDLRVLVVEGDTGAMSVVASGDLATLFRPGDVVVVNDAATLPASLAARTAQGDAVELRLVSRALHGGDQCWTVALLGAGDWRTRTEDRPPPSPVLVGDRLFVGERLVATVVERHAESARLVDVELSVRSGRAGGAAEVWSELYRVGRPVQYAYMSEPLALWDVQNVYGGRPWAVEMPSAGRVFRAETLLELRRRAVELVQVTHAAGLSSVGDEAIDTRLPLPERYEVPEATWRAIARARSRGGRVVAVGTSVVRALESAALSGKAAGVTDLHIGPATPRAVVDAVLTGVHDVDTSHFRLLLAFADHDVLGRVQERAEREGLLGHEMGDACLVWGQPRDNLRVDREQAIRAPSSKRGEAGVLGSPAR
jgi:S-adenosylmethionine:tRNA ribosyltransferase-isomerase